MARPCKEASVPYGFRPFGFSLLYVALCQVNYPAQRSKGMKRKRKSICQNCGGLGRVPISADAFDGLHTERCVRCNGTGRETGR